MSDSVLQSEHRLGRGGEGEEDEETFFDAHEISAEDWAKSTRAEFIGSEDSSTVISEGPVTFEKPPFNEKSMEEVSHICTPANSLSLSLTLFHLLSLSVSHSHTLYSLTHPYIHNTHSSYTLSLPPQFCPVILQGVS